MDFWFANPLDDLELPRIASLLLQPPVHVWQYKILGFFRSDKQKEYFRDLKMLKHSQHNNLVRSVLMESAVSKRWEWMNRCPASTMSFASVEDLIPNDNSKKTLEVPDIPWGPTRLEIQNPDRQHSREASNVHTSQSNWTTERWTSLIGWFLDPCNGLVGFGWWGQNEQ